MIVLRFVVLALTCVTTVITLFVSVTVLLGMGWVAVAVPVLVVIGLIAAVRVLWRRVGGRRPPGAGPPE